MTDGFLDSGLGHGHVDVRFFGHYCHIYYQMISTLFLILILAGLTKSAI